MLRRAALSIFMLSLACIAPPANALTLVLDNIEFSDGGEATGFFTLNTYGYLAYPDTITTTAGSSLPGATLAGSVSFYALPASFSYTLASPSIPAEEVTLELLYDPTSVTYDPLVLGGASFECAGPAYSCTTTRTIIAGGVEVPEPPVFALLASGLIALAGLRRRS